MPPSAFPASNSPSGQTPLRLGDCWGDSCCASPSSFEVVLHLNEAADCYGLGLRSLTWGRDEPHAAQKKLLKQPMQPEEAAERWQHFVDLSGASGRLILGKGSPAPRDGDEVLAVNGVELADMTHAQAVGAIRHCQPPLRLELYRPVPSPTIVKPLQRLSHPPLFSDAEEALYDNVDIHSLQFNEPLAFAASADAVVYVEPVPLALAANAEGVTYVEPTPRPLAPRTRRRSYSFHGLSARSRTAATSDAAENDAAENDAAENDTAENDTAENDAAKRAAAEHAAAEHAATVNAEAAAPPVPPRRLSQLGKSISDLGERLYLAPRELRPAKPASSEALRISLLKQLPQASPRVTTVPPCAASPRRCVRSQPATPPAAPALKFKPQASPARVMDTASLAWSTEGTGRLVLKGVGIGSSLTRVVARALLELGLLESAKSAFRTAHDRNSHTFYLSAPKLAGTPPLLSLALSRTCRALLAHGFDARPQRSRENLHRIHLARPAGLSSDCFLRDGMKR